MSILKASEAWILNDAAVLLEQPAFAYLYTIAEQTLEWVSAMKIG
jgi:hypothetical protein